MRNYLLIITCLITICLCSCYEKIHYGTSIVIENQLNDTIFIKLYPKETPYSYMTDYKLLYSESESIYWKSGQNEIACTIIQAVFDSIVIKHKDFLIIFSNDTVIGYSINPYHESDSWESSTIEYDTPDNFNRNPHKDIVYKFTLTEIILYKN